MTTVLSATLVILGLVASGLVPAILLAGPSLFSLFLAPLVTALLATAAGILSVATGTMLMPWVVPIFVLANGAAALRLWQRGMPTASEGGLLPSGIVALAALSPLAAMRGPQLGWDARSTWLEHASWFLGGGAYTQDVMRNLAYEFSSRDYPPLISSVVAAVWRVWGGMDLIVGNQVITVLNICAVGLVGLAFVRLFGARLKAVAGLAGAAVCLSAYGFAHSASASGTNIAVNGYADLLWAAAAVAGTMFMLVLPRDRTNFLIGLLATSVAGLTKVEGLPVSLIIIALSLLRYRSDLRRLLPFAAGSGFLIISWPVLAQLLHAGSAFLKGAPGLYGFGVDASRDSGPDALLRGDPDVWNRLAPTFEFMNPYYLGLAVVAALLTIAGVLGVQSTRRALRMGSFVWMWMVFLGTLASVAAAYLISPYDLAWHAGTSVDRTSIVLRLLLVGEIAGWTLCAISYGVERASSWKTAPVMVLRDRKTGAEAVYDLKRFWLRLPRKGATHPEEAPEPTGGTSPPS